ncbi:MAG TPA: protease, partial [Verrucomicrobiae bacterium]|nr:protease [Verrucomicrobiae bacterium]
MRLRSLFSISVISALIFAPLVLAAEFERGYFRYPAIHGETIVFTAEGDLWKGTIHGGIAQRLTTHPATETHAAISPDGRFVAFSAEYEGPEEVYTMPIEGGVPTRATYEGEGAVVVGWTPDGKVLYSTEKYSTLPNNQVSVFDLKTGARTLLPLAQASEGMYADDAKTFIFTRLPFQGSSTKRYKGGTAQNLWKFTEGSEEAVPLTADYPGTSRNPMWWKDRVYFLCDQDGIMNIWSMKSDGSERKEHTHHRGWDVKQASLSEGRIAYSIGADLRLYDIENDADSALHFTLPSDYDQQRDKWVKKPIDYLTAAHLSTNGDRVVLTARGQVFVAPVKDGRFVEATRNPSVRYRNGRFFSKDSLLAMTDQSGELEFSTLPANGVGVPKPVTDTGKVFRYDGVPSPNEKWIAYVDKDFQLFVWDVTKKKETLVATSNFGPHDDLTWSPDGEWLAYVESADNMFQRIFLYHPADGKKLALTSDRVDSYSPAWSPDGKWIYFLSDREIRSMVQSPWGARQPEPFFDQITKIYQIALKKDLRSAFQPNDELYDPEEDKKKDKDEKSDKTEEKKEKDEKKDSTDSDKKSEEDKKSKKEEPVIVEIDEDGIAARIQEVPVPAGDYHLLSVTAKH